LALTSTEHKKQLGYAKVINQELTLQKNPKLNVNIKSDHVSKLTSDVNQIEQLERERLKKEAFQKKFNITVGLVSFIISLMFFLILSLSDSSFATLVFGFLISIVIGISAGLYFRKKDSDFSQKESKVNSMFAKQDSVNSKGSDDDSRGDEKTSQIARAASSFVFPKKYNTIEDKIFDINTIRAKIQSNLEDIKKSVPILAKESDLNKVASSIEYSLITNSVVIAIPNDLVPKGKPQSLIINKEDFKSPLLRNQMSEHFRAVAEKNKYDTALVKYYTFLINTFELEYYKFLNKKIG
jgi:ABC-type multidrug transport system fused ATPase/permease subunit